MPDTEAGVTDLQWMQQALHDLSQPLTTMECRLHLGLLASGGEPETSELVDTLREAHAECERLVVGFRSMQDRLSQNT